MKKASNNKNPSKLALASKNAKIAESMKRVHAERKQKEQERLELQEMMNQRFASISAFRDAYKTSFVSISTQQIRAILESTKTGLLNQWSDFADYMIQTDPHLQGIINIRTHAISGRSILIQPSDNSEEAKAAASFARECISNIPSFDKFIRQLLMAEFKGASMAEIMWKRDEVNERFIIEELAPISLRKAKIRLMPVTKDGEVVNTSTTTGYGVFKYAYWNYGDTNTGDAIDLFDLYPGKFIIHSPGDQELLHDRGILKAAAFIWFFKQAALAYYVSASEKYASPVTFAKVPRATPENTRLNLVDNLNALANDAAAVFDEDVVIDTINVANSGGAAIWQQLISMLNGELSKLVLGGTLSVEAGSTGANRALGEVMERTRIDLQIADANALSETIKHQLVKPLLENNLHMFGGKMPPLPTISFDIITRDYEPISQMHLDAGVITVNELRDSVGLPAWSKDQGGDNIAKLAATEDPMAQLGLTTNESNLDAASTVYNGKKKLAMNEAQQDQLNEDDILCYIRKSGSEYTVYSENGKPMGTYKTRQEALDSLQAIEYYKNQ